MTSLNIEYNNIELMEEVLKNTLKMLERRHLITSWEEELKKLDINENSIIYDIFLHNNLHYSIYLLNTPLTTIVNGSHLDEYLSQDINSHKIVIGKNISKKLAKQLYQDYQNTEFFFENEMLEDIPSKIIIPEHQLLIKEEKEELLSKISENNLGKIFLFDMMTRYYNAKIGDIFRIIRKSNVAGYSIYYRKVINSPIDLIFP